MDRRGSDCDMDSELYQYFFATEFVEKMNLGSPLIDLTETELRDLCRHHINTFEKWSRRIIDEKFKESYGLDYFNYKISPE